MSLLNPKQYEFILWKTELVWGHLYLSQAESDPVIAAQHLRRSALLTLGLLRFLSRWGFKAQAYTVIAGHAEHCAGHLSQNALTPDLSAEVEGMLMGLRQELKSARPPESRRRRLKNALMIGFACIVVLLVVKITPFVYRVATPYGIHVTVYGDEAMTDRIGRAHKSSVFASEDDYLPFYFMVEDAFTAKWDGYLIVPKDGLYEFFSEHTFGMTVRLDDEILVSNLNNEYWTGSGRHAKRQLKAGVHPLVLVHHVREGRGNLRLRWSGPGIEANTIVSAPDLVKLPPEAK